VTGAWLGICRKFDTFLNLLGWNCRGETVLRSTLPWAFFTSRSAKQLSPETTLVRAVLRSVRSLCYNTDLTQDGLQVDLSTNSWDLVNPLIPFDIICRSTTSHRRYAPGQHTEPNDTRANLRFALLLCVYIGFLLLPDEMANLLWTLLEKQFPPVSLEDNPPDSRNQFEGFACNFIIAVSDLASPQLT
jgi:hypothetical protein